MFTQATMSHPSVPPPVDPIVHRNHEISNLICQQCIDLNTCICLTIRFVSGLSITLTRKTGCLSENRPEFLITSWPPAHLRGKINSMDFGHGSGSGVEGCIFYSNLNNHNVLELNALIVLRVKLSRKIEDVELGNVNSLYLHPCALRA